MHNGEPGYDHPDMYNNQSGDTGDCECCERTNIDLFDLGHTLACGECVDEQYEASADSAYEDHVLSRQESGYRDAGGRAYLGGW